MIKKLKRLYLDIEICPTTLAGMGKYNAGNFGGEQGIMIVFGYRWEGGKSKTLSIRTLGSIKGFNERPLVHAVHKIMSQADEFVGHYSDKFDLPYLNTKFLKYGLTPLSETKSIDTFKIARKYLKMASCSLGNLCRFLGVSSLKTGMQHQDWYAIIQGDMKKLREMEVYCAHDVDAVYALFNEKLKLLPYSTPHVGLRTNKGYGSCGYCGGTNLYSNGIRVTAANRYRRLTCADCNKHTKGPIIK